MEKHFVTFESPGTLMNETTTQPIDSWDIEAAVKMSRKITERYEARPFAFYFTTRTRKDSELDSKITKESGRYFLGGRILTLADVEREMPKETILIANMRCNKWDRIVLNDNSWRSCQLLRAKDTVLEYSITP